MIVYPHDGHYSAVAARALSGHVPLEQLGFQAARTRLGYVEVGRNYIGHNFIGLGSRRRGRGYSLSIETSCMDRHVGTCACTYVSMHIVTCRYQPVHAHVHTHVYTQLDGSSITERQHWSTELDQHRSLRACVRACVRTCVHVFVRARPRACLPVRVPSCLCAFIRVCSVCMSKTKYCLHHSPYHRAKPHVRDTSC